MEEFYLLLEALLNERRYDVAAMNFEGIYKINVHIINVGSKKTECGRMCAKDELLREGN